MRKVVRILALYSGSLGFELRAPESTEVSCGFEYSQAITAILTYNKYATADSFHNL
jgi:hypothetical protein